MGSELQVTLSIMWHRITYIVYTLPSSFLSLYISLKNTLIVSRSPVNRLWALCRHYWLSSALVFVLFSCPLGFLVHVCYSRSLAEVFGTHIYD